ncbi:RNase H domain-containing protein [Trichonephila clavipes]|nr:RNase H domain-containing protein [Trichonephila clavipes]
MPSPVQSNCDAHDTIANGQYGAVWSMGHTQQDDISVFCRRRTSNTTSPCRLLHIPVVLNDFHSRETTLCITPIDSFNHVEFRQELLTSTPKHSCHPELLRQLALEVINDIPDQAFIIYTDGSRSDTGRAGSGIFSNTPGNDVKISIRNPDHCSVFRSELIAISGALDHALNSYKDSIWILTDTRSSIQYLKNWPNIMDNSGLDILSKLVRLGQRKQVCLQ